MLLFDVGEQVVAGWPVNADLRKRRLYLQLGRDKGDRDAHLFLRFGSSLSNLVFPEAVQEPEMLENLELLWGSLMSDSWGLCLTKLQYPDTECLVRSGIAPGVGGSVRYEFGKGANVLAEGVCVGEETEYPIFLLRLTKGARFEVRRNGELEGSPAKLSFTWTGTKLVQE